MSQNIQVTSLGHILTANFPIASSNPKQVGLWTNTGVLLDSTSVLSTDPITSGYAFHNLTTPINLTAGTYRIGTLEMIGDKITIGSTNPASGQYWPNIFTKDNNFTLGISLVSSTPTLSFPTTNANGQLYFNSNLEYNILPTPEPSTYLLLGSTLLLALLA